VLTVGALLCLLIQVEGGTHHPSSTQRLIAAFANKEQRITKENLWSNRGGFAPSSAGRRPGIFSPRRASSKRQSTYFPTTDKWEKIRYNVLDSDLVLPSKRSLPPIVEELSHFVDATTEVEQSAETQVSRKLDMALFLTYACNTFVLSLPVVLMPLVAAEYAAAGPPGTKFVASGFIAAAASISSLGGGFGKVVNGFVCQAVGARRSASFYLFAMGIVAFLFSMNTSMYAVGFLCAGFEFCASMQWTAHSVLLVNHYETSPVRFAAGMTTLSMASTVGIIMAKVGGATFLQYIPSWRTLARIGAGVAVTGGLLAQGLVSEFPEAPKSRSAGASSTPTPLAKPRKSLKPSDIMKSLRIVTGSKMFWLAGLSHAATSLARTSDKILGSFFQDTTGLSTNLCGALTAFVTLGFLSGLGKGRAFHQLKDTVSKSRMLKRSYALSVMATLGMALCANQWLTGMLIPSKTVLAIVAASFSAVMASSLSIQYFQIPTLVATTFGENKAVCLSFLDGLAFFLSAPILATTGQVVARLGDHGWSVALTMLAAAFGIGGLLMGIIFPSVVASQEESLAAK